VVRSLGARTQIPDVHEHRSILRKNPEPGETEMTKGDKRRGNREVKKPKKVKEKVVATADFTKGKSLTNLGEHKKK
jgi:hypothetical protein